MWSTHVHFSATVNNFLNMASCRDFTCVKLLTLAIVHSQSGKNELVVAGNSASYFVGKDALTNRKTGSFNCLLKPWPKFYHCSCSLLSPHD